MTTKEFMKELGAVDPKWLVELAPRFFKVFGPTKISKHKRQEHINILSLFITATINPIPGGSAKDEPDQLKQAPFRSNLVKFRIFLY